MRTLFVLSVSRLAILQSLCLFLLSTKIVLEKEVQFSDISIVLVVLLPHNRFTHQQKNLVLSHKTNFIQSLRWFQSYCIYSYNILLLPPTIFTLNMGEWDQIMQVIFLRGLWCYITRTVTVWNVYFPVVYTLFSPSFYGLPAAVSLILDVLFLC
jgi:hypothetical protein